MNNDEYNAPVSTTEERIELKEESFTFTEPRVERVISGKHTDLVPTSTIIHTLSACKAAARDGIKLAINPTQEMCGQIYLKAVEDIQKHLIREINATKVVLKQGAKIRRRR